MPQFPERNLKNCLNLSVLNGRKKSPTVLTTTEEGIPLLQILHFQEQAKVKNNPNILAGKEANPAQDYPPKQQGDRHKKWFKTNIRPPGENKEVPVKEEEEDPGKGETKSKHCPCHKSSEHNLSKCKTFAAKNPWKNTCSGYSMQVVQF